VIEGVHSKTGIAAAFAQLPVNPTGALRELSAILEQ
jgi:hypothetical protein